MGRSKARAGKSAESATETSAWGDCPAAEPSALPQRTTPDGNFTAADSKPPVLRYVGALTADYFQRDDYRMREVTRHALGILVGRIKPSVAVAPFLDNLETLIGKYRILRAQDRETLRSAREALDRLLIARRKAKELLTTYSKARRYFAARTRLATAWGNLQASIYPEDYRGLPRYPDRPPESLGDFEQNLVKLELLLSEAASIPVSAKKAGGRPRVERARHFVIELHRLAQEKLGPSLPSIRGGPFKQLISIAVQEVGWRYADLRPVLDAVEKPSPRTKPPA